MEMHISMAVPLPTSFHHTDLQPITFVFFIKEIIIVPRSIICFSDMCVKNVNNLIDITHPYT